MQDAVHANTPNACTPSNSIKIRESFSSRRNAFSTPPMLWPYYPVCYNTPMTSRHTVKSGQIAARSPNIQWHGHTAGQHTRSSPSCSGLSSARSFTQGILKSRPLLYGSENNRSGLPFRFPVIVQCMRFLPAGMKIPRA